MLSVNPVYQVLVTSGNQAPLAAGNPITALAVGQVGVFNTHTGLSLGTASTPAESQDFFIAVGTNVTGGATLLDVNGSAAQTIQKVGTKAYTHRNYSAAEPMIYDITNYKIYAEAEYGIKIEFRDQTIYNQYGYNQFTKTWIQTGGCPTGTDGTCADCGTNGDCNAFTAGMIDQINADPDQLVLAEYLDYTTTPGTPVVVAPGDVAAWIADPANAGLCLGIRLTSIPDQIAAFCNINLKYYNPRGTVLIVSLQQGFQCNGTGTVVQEIKYSEGEGYDIRNLEFEAGGWNGKPGPYRVSELIGTAREGFQYFAQVGTNYSQTDLSYEVRSVSNHEHFYASVSTIVAIPCADTTTRTGFIAILDAIYSGQFAPNAGNAALGTCVGAENTNEYPVANNGIKILA